MQGKTVRPILQAVGVMALLAGAAYLVALVALSFAFRSPPFRAYPPDAADIALLAQDVHVRIGGVAVVLPLAALRHEARFQTFRTDRGEDWRQQETAARAAFAGTANNPAAPLDLNRVYLGLNAWSRQDAHGSEWARLCPALSRNWAQSVCNDPWAPLLQSLPSQVALADARHLDVFKDTFLSFGDLGNADTLLQSMNLGLGQPALACGQPSRPNRASPCLAALRITADLVAVWFVQDGPDETATQQAAREGQALVALVTFGLGAAEDFPALTAAACATLRPGAGPFSGRTAHEWPCKD